MGKTVLFYSAGPYGPLGRQLATRAAHELCRNATALLNPALERSLQEASVRPVRYTPELVLQ